MSKVNSTPRISTILPDLPAPGGRDHRYLEGHGLRSRRATPLEYKFMHSGPGMGWADVTGWTTSDIWTWKATEDVVGGSTRSA